MQRKFLGLALISGLLLSAPLFAEGGSFNGLSVGATLGLNPNFFSANENVWANGSPFATANEQNFSDAEVNNNISYDGTNGLMGWNIGLVGRFGFMDNLFVRLGINYSHTLMGNTIKVTDTNADLGAGPSGLTLETEVSISSWALSFPISFGVGAVVGKTKMYAGVGPTLALASMTRTLTMSGTAADAMVAGGGAKNGEVTFSTGMTFGFHWLVGIEHEITPGISLGVDILTNFGGKVVTEKIANTSDTVKTGPGIQAISNTQSQSATDTALTQTVNLSGTRINIAVMKAF